MDDSERKCCECGCGAETRRDGRGGRRRFLRGHNLRGTRTGRWIEQSHYFMWVNGARKAEHRYLVEQSLGRALLSDEVVHHVDGNPLNNELTNLVVLTRAEHARIHFAGRTVRWWTDEEKKRAAELYDAGLNLDEVAASLGRPYVSTRDVIRASGASRAPNETRELRRAAQE